MTSLGPGDGHLAGPPQQLIGELGDQPGIFGNRNEAVGRHVAHVLVPPARERLEADHRFALEIDQRLEIGLYVAGGDGGAQFPLQPRALAHMLVQFAVEEAERGFFDRLGLVQRHIGAAHDFVRVRPRKRKQRDADAHAETVGRPAGRDRHGQGFDHAQGDAGGRFGAGEMARQDDEFVAAEARHQVAVADGAQEAAGDHDQGLVAGAMAVEVVDLLEAVEVEHQQRMRGAGARRRGDRRVQAVDELAAVGQAGERILHGEFARARFGGEPLARFAPLFAARAAR